MRPLLLLDVVGLTPALVRDHAPRLRALGERGSSAPMTTVLPAVTCSAQATMLTGSPPSEHGAVGNGWMDPDTMEPGLWRQSNRLVAGEKLYGAGKLRDPNFTCAKICWWFNQGAEVDWSITPKPYYGCDGSKLLDIYAWPPDYGERMKEALGPFPFFDFWGPKSGLPSSRWIADAALRTLEHQAPTLTLVYLPHLDYSHQRWGPADPRSIQAVAEIDTICGELIDAADARGVDVMVVSEYGIEAVDQPVHINRALRAAGLLEVRPGPLGELLDVFGSRAFALADHQLAHVYVQRDEDLDATRRCLEGLDGVDAVLDRNAQADAGLDHPRSGDLVCISKPKAWFTYYYWLDDRHAPDFARTVDIHRKPGYDPAELFVDPNLKIPQLRVARRLAQKILGFRYRMDVIPLDASLVGGSHGRLPAHPDHGPAFLSSRPFESCGGAPESGTVEMTSIKARALASIFEADTSLYRPRLETPRSRS